LVGADHESSGELPDDAGVSGQQPAGHDDSNGERTGIECKRLHGVCVWPGINHRLEHGDLSDQRDGDHDQQCEHDVRFELQRNVHAGDGEQRDRKLCGVHDTECAGVYAVGDTEHIDDGL
jgi:hypothetical protein